MFDFGALPPEINSGRMYAGPGPGPMLAAAAGWDGLAAELGTAATGYGSVISELTGSPWVGPASASMVAAAAPYVAWMSATAEQAEQAATQARAAAAAYDVAFAMTVPPPVIAANRALLATLIATNFFGQNTPAIAATEAHYGEMWAQDAVAMYGYAASSATAAALDPFNSPPLTANTEAITTQAEAVGQALAAPVGNAAASVAPTLAVASLLSAPGLGFSITPSSVTLPSWFLGPTGLIATIFGDSTNIWNSVTNYPYFALGSVNSLISWGGGLLPGAPAPNPALGGALTPPGAIGAWGTPVSAGWGQAGTIGKLSVPPVWAANTVSAVSPLPSTPAGFDGVGAATSPGAKATTNGVLSGLPASGVGRRAATGYANKYGFKYNVLTRSPSAG
ncbi:hypothetical protein A5634_13100 [Mycobacterium asiaticum]|uniref:PPE family protein n=1 Tax=Mycobacterium asiaticum TaxID=1790 RepID=A0A1A3PBY7_MYCAS|nr:PPE family protein [Mycobacterium asiaticum]OBK31666.1 hypothetical protein A5634_13100 [Mycobacterium asiaticum]